MGIENLSFKLFLGSTVVSVLIGSWYEGGGGGTGAGFLKEILGTDVFGGNRSYFFIGLGGFGTTFAIGFVRT